MEKESLVCQISVISICVSILDLFPKTGLAFHTMLMNSEIYNFTFLSMVNTNYYEYQH